MATLAEITSGRRLSATRELDLTRYYFYQLRRQGSALDLLAGTLPTSGAGLQTSKSAANSQTTNATRGRASGQPASLANGRALGAAPDTHHCRRHRATAASCPACDSSARLVVAGPDKVAAGRLGDGQPVAHEPRLSQRQRQHGGSDDLSRVSHSNSTTSPIQRYTPSTSTSSTNLLFERHRPSSSPAPGATPLFSTSPLVNRISSTTSSSSVSHLRHQAEPSGAPSGAGPLAQPARYQTLPAAALVRGTKAAPKAAPRTSLLLGRGQPEPTGGAISGANDKYPRKPSIEEQLRRLFEEQPAQRDTKGGQPESGSAADDKRSRAHTRPPAPADGAGGRLQRLRTPQLGATSLPPIAPDDRLMVFMLASRRAGAHSAAERSARILKWLAECSSAAAS